MNNLKYSNGSATYVESLEKKIAELEKQIVAIDMNNEPVAWMPIQSKHTRIQETKPDDEQNWIPLYLHPVKDINEAIEIIKDFQNSDVPPCKDYENTYADGWMDACNEILWAIEEKAQEK